ncbi:MAG: nucleotide sugar dehydrogenase, partial [Pirellulales bacterium]
VGIIGLGYVGLPLIQAFMKAGFNTIGYDVDQSKVDSLLAGKSYISHIKSEWIAECIASERFSPTADMSRLAEADCLLICVPTPLNESRDPDLKYIELTGQQIAKYLRPDQLIVLESTTYPGTSRDVLLPILAQSGLQAGRDYFLAYSPEREDPGNPDFSTARIPKVVSGYDPVSLTLAEALYGGVVGQLTSVGSLEVAEACKILENTYRAVNIALVNELKVLFDRMGIDVWEVIDAAKTKPFGFQAFYPGPGLGGHCIPIDPFYLTWLARKHGMSTRFIELAGEINTHMPQYVFDKIVLALNENQKALRGSKVCLLGVAYKKDVDDPRESPAFRLMELLAAGGAKLAYNDPHIPVLQESRHFKVPHLESQELTPEFLASQDCVVIVTDHTKFDFNFITKHAEVVIDTRNATRGVTHGREKVRKA